MHLCVQGRHEFYNGTVVGFTASESRPGEEGHDPWGSVVVHWNSDHTNKHDQVRGGGRDSVVPCVSVVRRGAGSLHSIKYVRH